MAPGLVRFVMLGSVDHGKSTLAGRLLLDTGSLAEDRLEQARAVSSRRGLDLELAFALDALQSERDQLITIDAAHVWFRTPVRAFAIVDAPGHADLICNAVTGASVADAALILVDAREGLRDDARRLAMFLRLLGVEQTAVVVNKMDLVDHSPSVFAAVEAEGRRRLREVGVVPTHVIPASARDGTNVCTRSPVLHWYEGPTVLEALEGFRPRVPPVEAPLRLPVQDVYRLDERRILVGRIESGRLRVGDEVVFSPWNKVGFVRTIERWGEAPLTEAVAGEAIGFTLDAPLFVERGQVVSHKASAPVEASSFEATVFWLGSEDLRSDAEYRLKLVTQDVICRVTTLRQAADGAPLRRLRRGEVASAVIHTRAPMALDDFADLPATGRFVLYDGAVIAGGGTVSLAGCADRRPELSGFKSTNLGYTHGRVARDERARRTGHAGRVVWLTGLPGSGKSTIAVALERALFDRGYLPYLLDGDNLRQGLSADLGFTEADRRENVRRTGEVARLLADAGLIAIVALISPCRADRDRVRAGLRRGEFIEVLVDCPLAVCEQRDPKGLYRKAREGKLTGLTGIDAPYEPPHAPDVLLATDRLSVADCVQALLERVVTPPTA